MGVTGIKKSASLHFFERKPVVSTYPGEEPPPVVERHIICHSWIIPIGNSLIFCAI